jgi:chromosome partitioning protein
MIITVAQQKGGAGKTTLAAQLAATYMAQGKRVATVDTDPQASLTKWAEVRRELLGDYDNLHHVQASGWRTNREVEALARDYDYVIVDSPPHAETDAKLAIRAADLILVPLQPSPMDIWASQATLELARQERVPVLIVPNRVPARSSMAEGILANLDQLGAAVSKVSLGSRIAFAESMLNGRGVVESHRLSTAADEISALSREIIRRTASQRRKVAAAEVA